MLRYWVVLLDELVYGHETASHTDNQVVILDLHHYLLREIAVMAGLLALTDPHEQAFHSLLRVTLVNEVR